MTDLTLAVVKNVEHNLSTVSFSNAIFVLCGFYFINEKKIKAFIGFYFINESMCLDLFTWTKYTLFTQYIFMLIGLK